MTKYQESLRALDEAHDQYRHDHDPAPRDAAVEVALKAYLEMCRATGAEPMWYAPAAP